MASDERPLSGVLNNVDWMNAVRNEAGFDYQQRIPEATQANVQEVVNTLWKYKPYMNQFVDALVNRIGLVLFYEWQFANPLAPLKRGMLSWGETIEEIMVGLIEADTYDSDRDELERELFGAKEPEVQANYHTVNRRDKYKLTIKEPLLRNAFLTENGLSTFMAQLLGAAQKSDQFDEYLLMVNLIKEMDTAAGGFYNVNVADVADEDSTPEESKYVLRRMREFGHTLRFPSRQYNPAGMHQAITPDNLILLTTPGARAAMDVEALAAAFNIQKAEFETREFVLPVDHYGIPGFQAALTTKEFWVVADQRIDTTSLYNPSSLFTNYWLHHWQVMSASRFAPFVMFNSERESTTISKVDYKVTGISDFAITDAEGGTVTDTVKRGEVYSVAVQAETTPAGGPGVAVRSGIDGHKSIFTRHTNNGVLSIAPDEEAKTVTISATAVDSNDVPQMSKTLTLNIVGALVRPWPNPEVRTDNDGDGILEGVVKPLTMSDDKKVTIPTVTGVQYRKGGVNVNNKSVHEIVAETTFDAVARDGHELDGGPYTWTFTP